VANLGVRIDDRPNLTVHLIRQEWYGNDRFDPDPAPPPRVAAGDSVQLTADPRHVPPGRWGMITLHTTSPSRARMPRPPGPITPPSRSIRQASAAHLPIFVRVGCSTCLRSVPIGNPVRLGPVSWIVAMRFDLPLERLLQQIATLDRADCIAALKQLPRPRLDFTDAYLEQQNVDELRHLLTAAVLAARRHYRQTG